MKVLSMRPSGRVGSGATRMVRRILADVIVRTSFSVLRIDRTRLRRLGVSECLHGGALSATLQYLGQAASVQHRPEYRPRTNADISRFMSKGRPSVWNICVGIRSVGNGLASIIDTIIPRMGDEAIMRMRGKWLSTHLLGHNGDRSGAITERGSGPDPRRPKWRPVCLSRLVYSPPFPSSHAQSARSLDAIRSLAVRRAGSDRETKSSVEV